MIKGWTEAMQLMVEGDKFEMYIPSDLAYGESGSPPKIPGASVPSYLTQSRFAEVNSPTNPSTYPFTITGVKNKVTDFCWNRLLTNDFQKTCAGLPRPSRTPLTSHRNHPSVIILIKPFSSEVSVFFVVRNSLTERSHSDRSAPPLPL